MGDFVGRRRHGQANNNFQKNTCRICCCSVMSIFVISVVVVNTYHFSPKFGVKRLYIPALDKSLNASTNASIILDLFFLNRERLSKVYYDTVNIRLYDSPNQNHSIANFTISEFTQKDFLEEKDAKLIGTLKSGTENATRFDVEDAKREIAVNGFKVFHISSETSVRYDYYLFWKTKLHGWRRGADVKIGDTSAANFVRQIFVWFRISFAALVFIILSADIF